MESIITTHDELYKAELSFTGSMTPAAKEVKSYVDALLHGFDRVKYPILGASRPAMG